jgi:hypothetical protein
MRLALAVRGGVVLFVLGVFVVACGSTKTGPPPNPPKLPKLSRPGPPPAWVETKAGSTWLGYSTYCWRSVCADYDGPDCRSFLAKPPGVVLTPGETVRFHLGFDPEEVSVTSGGRTTQLDSSRTPQWRVAMRTPLILRTKTKVGDASYVGCLAALLG